MPAKSTKRGEELQSLITEEQWAMPVSFDMKGKPVSLRDYVQDRFKAIPFGSLSDEQRTELAIKRIELQRGYEMGAIGVGIISKERAVEEVRTKTKLGRRLAGIEIRVITHLLDEAAKTKD